MIDPRRSIPILAALVLILAACGSSGSGGTATEVPATAAPAGQSQAVVEAPASTAASDASPAPEGPAGGQAGDVCELVTEAELGGILGASVKTTVFAGPPDTCDIQSTDGAPLAATVLTRNAAPFVYDVFVSDAGTTSVSGIGEKAAYNPVQAILVVFKNGSLLTVAVFDDGSGSTDEAARLDRMKQIGAIAAGRM